VRAVIATVQAPFERGGAEILVEDLHCAMAGRGHDVEIVTIPWQWYPSEHLLYHMAACRLFDLTQSAGRPIDLLIGMKFPAYLIPHPNKVLWLMHQQRSAYELWNGYYGLSQDPRGAQIRDTIRNADRRAIEESQRVHTIAQNVSGRLERFLGIESTPLCPPPRLATELHCAPAEDYIFFPGRISPPKRHKLVLEALSLTEQPVRIRIAGSAESPTHEAELHRMADELGISSRIDWTGWINEADLVDGYARCVGVVFTPLDEDYGYVTLEAMLAAKPVVTCRDSGEPLAFITHGETGLICEPEPAAIASSLDTLWRDRNAAREWGVAGRQHYDKLGITWDRVLDSLLA